MIHRYTPQTFCYEQLKKDLRAASFGDVFTFEKGRYDIYESQTEKAYYAVSNCDAGVKNIAFYLKGKQNVTLNGNGSLFMFHGRVSPFVLDQCQNICIKGFTVDYEKAFYVQGEVIKSEENFLDLKLHPSVELVVEGGELVQKIESAEVRFTPTTTCMWQAFDRDKKRVLYGSNCRIVRFSAKSEEETEKEKFLPLFSGDVLRVYGREMDEFPVGCAIVFYGELRNANTVFANRVEGLTLTDITIHYTPSFGVNCQICKNVSLTRVNCLLGEERHGLVTADADATHFIACSGRVRLTDCFFENMLDDGANIHGIFTNVLQAEGNRFVLELAHNQQRGVNVYLPGDTVIFYREKTLAPVCKAKILTSCLLDDGRVEITTKRPVRGVFAGDQAENYSRQAKFYMVGCTVQNNRPRGVLVATRKKAVVKNCTFSTSSSGVEVSADSNYWYESGGVNNLLIKNNAFIDCCHQYGGAVIGVVPRYQYQEGKPRYCKNIRVIGNKVVTEEKLLLFAQASENIVVRNNERRTASGERLSGEVYYTENCASVHVKNSN